MAVVGSCAPTRTLRRWQREALPIALVAIVDGKRGIVEAVMGAGKSILIAEVLAEVISWNQPGALIVTAPTTKLVEQLEETFVARLGRQAVGVYYTEKKQPKCHVVVCCNASATTLAEELAVMGKPVRLWIADEAHRTEAAEIKIAAEVFKAQAAIGFSATPFRSRLSERLSIWDVILYRYPVSDGQRDGVIVPARVVPWDGDEKVPVDDAVIEMIRAHGKGPGVVSATTIADAEAYANTLRKAGIMAAAVHSKHSRMERNRLLEDLRTGVLRCLVHVSLLAEGVDLPFLRWLCIRRAVGARTRFVQEVGRVLRAYPGKTEGIILDPHDLFDTYSLTYNAMLGWEEPEAVAEPDPDRPPTMIEAERQTKYAQTKTELAAWARRLYLSAEADGIIQPSAFPAGAWRRKPPTSVQRGAVKRACYKALRWMPNDHAQIANLTCKNDAIVTAGMASDLLDLFRALAERKKPWTFSEPIEAPSEASVDMAAQVVKADQKALKDDLAHLAADPKLYIAVVLRRDKDAAAKPLPTGKWAYVAMQYGKSVSENCLVLKDGDRFGALYLYVVTKARVKYPAATVPIVLPESKFLPLRLIEMEGVLRIDEKDHCAVALAWKLLRKSYEAGAHP